MKLANLERWHFWFWFWRPMSAGGPVLCPSKWVWRRDNMRIMHDVRARGTWSVHNSPPSYPPTVVAYRQCRVVYFDAKSSTWFESDALVVAEYAVAGLLVHDAKIPGVGYVRAWVKDVYDKPRLTPPA